MLRQNVDEARARSRAESTAGGPEWRPEQEYVIDGGEGGTE